MSDDFGTWRTIVRVYFWLELSREVGRGTIK